jgi:hypothetical protein
MEKFKVLIEKYWKKLLDLGTRARYGSKAIDVIVSFLTRQFRKVAAWKITIYVVSLLTSVVATAAGAAGAAATGGISALVAAVVDEDAIDAAEDEKILPPTALVTELIDVLDE